MILIRVIDYNKFYRGIILFDYRIVNSEPNSYKKTILTEIYDNHKGLFRLDLEKA